VLLRGFRRIVWGDLSRKNKDEPEAVSNDAVEELKLLETKEKEYAGFLIMSVARRTNSFRISTYLTRIALVFLAFLLPAGIISAGVFTWRGMNWKKGAGVTPVPPIATSIVVNGGIVQVGNLGYSPLFNSVTQVPTAGIGLCLPATPLTNPGPIRLRKGPRHNRACSRQCRGVEEKKQDPGSTSPES
jgi:hypothetical protein